MIHRLLIFRRRIVHRLWLWLSANKERLKPKINNGLSQVVYGPPKSSSILKPQNLNVGVNAWNVGDSIWPLPMNIVMSGLRKHGPLLKSIMLRAASVLLQRRCDILAPLMTPKPLSRKFKD